MRTIFLGSIIPQKKYTSFLIAFFVVATIFITCLISSNAYSLNYQRAAEERFPKNDSMVLDESKGKVYLYGGATLSSEKIDIQADLIEYDLFTSNVTAKGSVSAIQKTHNVTIASEEFTCRLFPTQIIQNYLFINSISELKNLFKGKPVFIDLWASWCDPCIEEFQFSKTLYETLTKNNVEVLYISFDKDERDEAWKNLIKKYDLPGFHVRANKKLQDELTTLIWGAVDVYSIPNYLLMDRSGSIVEKHFLKPSQGVQFYEALRKGLSLK